MTWRYEIAMLFDSCVDLDRRSAAMLSAADQDRRCRSAGSCRLGVKDYLDLKSRDVRLALESKPGPLHRPPARVCFRCSADPHATQRGALCRAEVQPLSYNAHVRVIRHYT